MNYGFHHHQELGQTKEVGFKVKGLLTFPTFHFVVCLNTSSFNLSFNQNPTTDTCVNEHNIESCGDGFSGSVCCCEMLNCD